MGCHCTIPKQPKQYKTEIVWNAARLWQKKQLSSLMAFRNETILVCYYFCWSTWTLLFWWSPAINSKTTDKCYSPSTDNMQHRVFTIGLWTCEFLHIVCDFLYISTQLDRKTWAFSKPFHSPNLTSCDFWLWDMWQFKMAINSMKELQMW